MQKKIVVIGGGVGGLATACLLGKAGYRVTVLEKNEQLGGRAGQLQTNGFMFDTGPSWYLMPGVFEHFFNELGESVADHLQLVKLAPSFRVFYKDLQQRIDMTGNLVRDAETFEAIEKGAGERLKKYLTRAAYSYQVSVDRFLYQNYDRLNDFMTPEVLRAASKLSIFSTLHNQVRRSFTDQRLQKLMEYPAMFLGASPYTAPALYSFMSHVLTQGVFYPMGGMYEFVRALVEIGKKYGVEYRTHAPVEKIIVERGRATGVVANGQGLRTDIVVSDAGRWHTETALLDTPHRDHTPRYWRSRTLAPSALLMYLGVDRQYTSLSHHNLLFSRDWRGNFQDIFGGAAFPADPSLYVCAASKTDPGAAPKGSENLFVLVPVAAGLQYTAAQLDEFTERILRTIERQLQLPGLRRHIVYQKQFCVDDFAARFNTPAGSGLGLAHTLKQTAVFRPGNQSKKVRGLYFVGADVHPGIGLPSTLISAELAYQRIVLNEA